MAGNETTFEGASGAQAQYTCPEHPQVREMQPGKCPTCGMDLQEMQAEQQG